MMRALRVGGLPSTILIGPDGREIARREGEADWDCGSLIQEIQKALGGFGGRAIFPHAVFAPAPTDMI